MTSIIQNQVIQQVYKRSIYYKPKDIWELPAVIISFEPSYKFYLRHYSIAASETVLYAI